MKRQWAAAVASIYMFLQVGCVTSRLEESHQASFSEDWAWLREKDLPSRFRIEFEESVKHVSGEGWGPESCHGAIACLRGGNHLRLTEAFWNLNLPRVVRLSVYVHEARHARVAKHVLCPKGLRGPFSGRSLDGLAECDADARGANGAQREFLQWIAEKCERCEAQDRREAQDFEKFVSQLILSGA